MFLHGSGQCGNKPNSIRRQGRLELSRAATLAGVPISAFHGLNDTVVPVGETERMIATVRNAGGNAKLTIFPDAGHGICEQVCELADLWPWLLAPRRPNR